MTAGDDQIAICRLLSAAPSNAQLQQRIDALPPLAPEASRALISGPPRRCAERATQASSAP